MITKELYMQSEFYEKYKDSYYSDCILKDFFHEDIKKHRISGLNTYTKIFEKDVEIMQDFLNLFWFKLNADYQTNENKDAAFKMLNSFYIDPDGASIKQLNNTISTADGLISIHRLFDYDGLTQKLVDDYKIYRKYPIIFFPRENGGINTTRFSEFRDRIDHTLFDIKRYFEAGTEEEKKACKLSHAYQKEKTKQWLSNLGSFSDLVDWLHIKGIFTDDQDNVFDLQKNDGSILTEYASSYPYDWDECYYNAVKQKIEQWNANREA